MKKCLFLFFFCLILAGCSAGMVSENKNETGETRENEQGAESQGSVSADQEESCLPDLTENGVLSSEKICTFLEEMEPELHFIPMEPEEISACAGELEESYELTGRKTEDGFRYILAVLKDGKESPLSGLTVYDLNNDLAAGIWDEENGTYDQKYLFTQISSLIQGTGNQVLYLQPEKSAVPEEIQQTFIYRFCRGQEGIRYLEDVLSRDVRFTPPSGGAYLSVERYEDGRKYTEYVSLSTEQEKEILESEKTVDPLVYGSYGIQFFVSEATYEQDGTHNAGITEPALEIAEERCRFRIVDPEEIHDIVKAEMKMIMQDYGEDAGAVSREWEETETLTDTGSLKMLEEVLRSSEAVCMEDSQYEGILTLTRKDGETVTVQVASDGSSFILGSRAVYSPGEENMEKLWSLFPRIMENTDFSRISEFQTGPAPGERY